jgi:hypothetical protein
MKLRVNISIEPDTTQFAYPVRASATVYGEAESPALAQQIAKVMARLSDAVSASN